MLVAALHMALPPPPAAPPADGEWVHVIPAGEFRGRDGRGPYRLADAAAVIAASMAAGPLPFDENHSTDHAAKSGAPSPARGWIVELQARADGIWARVEWTASGKALRAERAYRGVSPVFVHDKQGGVVRQLVRAALTNDPNLPQLTTLHAQQESPVDLTKLRAALGLPESADEAAILAAATAARAAVSTHAQQLGAIAAAAGATADAGPEAIVTAIQARNAAGDPAKLQETVVALQTQLSTLQAAQSRAAAEAAVDAAIRAGKPIAALRDHFVARHMQDSAAVAKELAALPSIHAGGIARPPAADGAPALSDEEARVVQLMGLDPKKFAEEKKRLGLVTEAA